MLGVFDFDGWSFGSMFRFRFKLRVWSILLLGSFGVKGFGIIWRLFLGNMVQSPIVDADSPTVLHPSRNQLLLLVFNHGEADFLWNYLDRTHPLVVGDRINDPSLQKLGYLLLLYIKNHWVESSLWLSYWFSLIL